MSLIEVEGVSFSYSGKQVLTDVALRIEEGSFVAVLGQSGAGKTTLVRILNATLKPDRGSVSVCGIECNDKASVFNARRNVGLVMQNPESQIIGDTVEDDVAFALENMGLGRDEMERRISSALEATSLSGLRFRNPRELSGGQKQLLAIAGVLAMQCRCIVLDEALSMLDKRARTEILALLHKLNRETGLSVVMMTHKADDAVSADVIHLMEKGRIVKSGSPKEVLASEASKQIVSQSFACSLACELRKRGMEIPSDIVCEDDLFTYLSGVEVSDA